MKKKILMLSQNISSSSFVSSFRFPPAVHTQPNSKTDQLEVLSVSFAFLRLGLVQVVHHHNLWQQQQQVVRIVVLVLVCLCV